MIPVGMSHAVIGRRGATPGVVDTRLRLAEDFLCAGTSTLFLLFARLHTSFSPLYLLALAPYFWRALHAGVWRSVYLGVTLATSYVLVAYADNLILAPVTFALQLLCFNIIFVSYGLAVCKARQVYGRSALLLFFLWLPIEYALNHFGGVGQLFAISRIDTGIVLRFTTLFEILAIPLLIVLLNPLLLLFAAQVVQKVLGRQKAFEASCIRRHYLLEQLAPVRRWFCFPDLRSPPVLASVLLAD